MTNDADCAKNPPRHIYINALVLHSIIALISGYPAYLAIGKVLSWVQVPPVGTAFIGIFVVVTLAALGALYWVLWLLMKPLFLQLFCVMDGTIDACWKLVKKRRRDR